MVLRSRKRLIANQLKAKFNKLVKFPVQHNKFQYMSKISRWYLTLIGRWPINGIHLVMKFCIQKYWLARSKYILSYHYVYVQGRSAVTQNHTQTLGNTYWSTENTDLWRRLMIACECYYKRRCSEIDDSVRGRKEVYHCIHHHIDY